MSGFSRDVSLLGVDLGVPTSPGPMEPDRAVALLRLARRHGVTTFRLPEGPHAPAAERWVGSAFPEADPDLLVIACRSLEGLLRSAGSGRTGESPRDVEESLHTSLRDTSARIAPQRAALVEWTRGGPAAHDRDDAVEWLENVRSAGLVSGYVWRLSARDERSPASEVRSNGPPLYAGELSLLDTRLLASHAGVLEASGGFFALDPFGGGRLDGSRLGAGSSDRRPDVRPVSVRELRREFEPVLSLGFLTEGRRRTLAQAALQFIYHWPWVGSALVPLPSPERLGELVAAESAPALSDAEVDRVLGAASGVAGG